METIELTEEQINNMHVLNKGGYESKILEYKNDYVIKCFKSHIWEEKLERKKIKLVRLSQKSIKENVITRPLCLVNINGEFSAYLMKKESGTTLKNIKDHDKLFQIYIELFKKLDYLHSKNICVSDLKPENIIAPAGIFCDVDSMGVDEFKPCYDGMLPNFVNKDNNIFYKLKLNNRKSLDYLLLLYSFILSLDDYKNKYDSFPSILEKLNLSINIKTIFKNFMEQDIIDTIPEFSKLLMLERPLYVK